MLLPQSSLDKKAYFTKDMDLAILKIDKEYMPNAKRVFVKNVIDVKNKALCESVSFPTMFRKDRTILNFSVKDNELFCLKLDEFVKDVEHLKAISGSGIYLTSEPYLIGVITGYRQKALPTWIEIWLRLIFIVLFMVVL